MKRKISAKVYKKKACNSQNCFDYPQVKKTHSVLKQGDFWLVIENKYPYLEYEGLKVIDHFLIIPKRNIINWAKVKKQELEELYTLSNSCLIGKDLKDIRVIMKCNLNKPSIQKIHSHILFLKLKKNNKI